RGERHRRRARPKIGRASSSERVEIPVVDAGLDHTPRRRVHRRARNDGQHARTAEIAYRQRQSAGPDREALGDRPGPPELPDPDPFATSRSANNVDAAWLTNTPVCA